MSSVYQALSEADSGNEHWVFGTGFNDPLAGVDTTVPSTVDGDDLAAYCLMLGDDALITSHRLQQWCTRCPELEDEVAVANIGLDLLGQARMLLARSGTAGSTTRSEDELAFFRSEREFRNVRLAELVNGDFAHTMARLLILSSWRLTLLNRLTGSVDPVLAAIAEKGRKELAYHRTYAAGWVVRLGQGTEFSHDRMVDGIAAVWPFVPELFDCSETERRMAAVGAGVDPSVVADEVHAVLDEVLAAAGIARPDPVRRAGVGGRTGRDGVHTEAMGYLLAELQSVARADPEATW